MNISLLRKLLVLGGALSFAASLQAQSWDFSSGDQNWLIKDFAGSGDYSTLYGTYTPDFQSSGGNPNQHISFGDPSGGSFFFQAPTALGDYSGFSGGALKFSLRTNLLPDYSDDSVVILRGGSLSLVAALGSQPGEGWTAYSIALNAGNFRYNSLSGGLVSSTDFATVLASLDTFLIDGEFHNGVAETSSLDSVSFERSPNVTPVPEPSTYGLLGAGVMAGLAYVRRRRRQA